jgi:hypothetical protein
MAWRYDKTIIGKKKKAICWNSSGWQNMPSFINNTASSALTSFRDQCLLSSSARFNPWLSADFNGRK